MQSRFVQAAELRVHVRELGRGEPLLLLHDWYDTSAAWLRLAPHLANSYSLVAPDARGVGATEGPPRGATLAERIADVGALLDALGIDGATLIGHGFGGTVAAHFAFAEPNRVHRLVLLDAPITAWPATTTFMHWLADGDTAERALATHGEALVAAWLGGSPRRLPRPRECPVDFTHPAFGTLEPYADHDELAAHRERLADPTRFANAAAPIRALRLHRIRSNESDGDVVEPLQPAEVAAMWRDGRAGRSCLDFAPTLRRARYDGAVLWIYSQYQLDFAHAYMDDEGRPAGDEALEGYLRHFPRVEARGIDAGHGFIGEKPLVTAQLMRKFLKKN